MITQGVFASSIGSMFLGENPEYANYIKKASIFGSNDVLIISFEEPALFEPKVMDTVQAITKKISKIKYVRSVRSALDVQRIIGTEDTISVISYADAAKENPEKAESIYLELKEDSLAKGLFVSNDGRYTNVIVEIDTEKDMPAEKVPVLIEEIITSFKGGGYDENQLHLVGLPINVSAFIYQTQFNISTLFPLVCIALLIVPWILFRRLWPVALTMTVATIAVIWTLGFSILLDRNISILASMVPAVILIISFSDVVHLCSAYLLELGSNKSKKEAIYSSGTDVGKACLLTSVTTFLGFLALSFVPAPIFRHLGVTLGFGVAMALLLAITLSPIFFHILPKPKPLRVGTTGRVQDFLDWFLTWIAKTASSHPWTIILVFSIIIIFSVVGVLGLKIETDFSKRLGPDHQVRIDEDFFVKNFAGSNAVDIFINTNRAGGILDPEVFLKMVAFQDALEQMPEVTKAYSLVDIIETMHKEMNADDAKTERVPDSKNALAQYMLTLESSGEEELERLVSFNRDMARVTVQLNDDAVVHTYLTGNKAEKIGNEIFGNSAQASVTGLMYLIGQWVDDIVRGQRRGLIFALISIAIMMIIGLRSISVGLWSMIPNVFPLLVLGGYLGIFWDQVDSDIMAIAMIAIGIGVDDTIHFLMRLRIESNRNDDVDLAIKNTFHFSGRGIVMTTVILVTGFAPFAIADYLSIHIMGTLLPLILVTALLGDLFLAPALVKVGAIRFKKNSNI